uniref:NADH-quinone oxidoreductase subunit F n=1 Tax=Desulfobacca acetoxidans TaxID=60893 RepID=A0A7C3V8I0_9BACT
MAEEVLLAGRRPDRPLTFDEYRQQGGYGALNLALRRKPEELWKIVSDAGLRGRGGAGFPTGKKWSFIGPGFPRYVVPNTDEMEPGTFKDRVLVNVNPHLVLEGIILAGYAISASKGIFFIRPSYEMDAELIEREIQVAREAGFLGKNILGHDFSFDLVVHRSAGRYICGEASAQVNAIMGRRAHPNKVVHMADTGLWGKPTIVNNVETLSCVPPILKNGPEWFRGLARSEKGAGTKLYCLSGRVVCPGCYELPMGTPFGEILEQAGGLPPGRELKAFLPGGASTSFMPKKFYEVPMDFDALEATGNRLGTGAIIVFDQNTCLVGATLNLIEYFARESCGFCTPCREGLPYIRDLLWRIEIGEGKEEFIPLLRQMSNCMSLSYCAFAPGAASPVLGLLNHFEDELREHLSQKKCPFGGPGIDFRDSLIALEEPSRPTV